MVKLKTGPMFRNEHLEQVGVAFLVPKGKTGWNEARAVFRCKCGAHFVAFLCNVKRNNTRSCGCHKLRINKEKATKHGGSKGKSDMYGIWCQMRNRCNGKTSLPEVNQAYHGRGIRYCERWGQFENFVEDMGPRPSKNHSIDRIDNDGNYEPANCRWVTGKEQMRNTRRTVWIEYNGQVFCQTDLATHLGMTRKMVSTRLANGTFKRV